METKVKSSVAAILLMLFLILLSATVWAVDDPIQGPTDDPCITCPPGPAGPAGPTGPAGKGSVGPRGRDGSDGKDGVTTIKTVCPDCLEDRIRLGDATIAALPSPWVGENKKYAATMASGFAMDQWAIGIGAGYRYDGHLVLSASVAANLNENCSDDQNCIEHYDPFEHVAGKVQVNWEW